MLLDRLVHLVETEGLHGGDELLVLSFSRAAVSEVRRRLVVRRAARAGYVRVVTFDSYATWLLALVDPEGTWLDQSYDDRIRACIGRPRRPRTKRREESSDSAIC